MDDRFPYNTPKYSNIPFMHIVSLTHLDFPPKKSWNNYTIFHLVKGSLDAKLPSYELLKMLKEIDS